MIGVSGGGRAGGLRLLARAQLQRGPIDTHAEGLATGYAYYVPVKTFIDKLDDMLLVSEDEISDAVIMLAEYAHQVAEEAGAAATAAAVQLGERLRGKKVVVMLSGGNMPLDGLRRVLLEDAP